VRKGGPQSPPRAFPSWIAEDHQHWRCVEKKSMLGSGRHVGEYDVGPRHSPSRLAEPDLFDTQLTWGRAGTESRPTTASEAGGRYADSPSYTTTPRTTFSGLSSSATSVSSEKQCQGCRVVVYHPPIALQQRMLSPSGGPAILPSVQPLKTRDWARRTRDLCLHAQASSVRSKAQLLIRICWIHVVF
jgi:hypothetical protein